VTFGLAYALDALRRAGVAPTEVTLVGGGAASDTWAQLCADAFALPVVRPAIVEAAASGAARQAQWAVEGKRPELAPVSSRRIEPNLSPSAIHGLGFERPWTALEQSATTVTMECELRGRGWPFGGSARQTLRLSGDALDLELAVGGYTRPGPAGLGWHPWFTRPPGGDLALTLDAHEVLVLDRDLVPT